MPLSACKLAKQVENLGLDRHVERRGRLVGDQQLRVAGERHGDHRPLPHAAGELVRVVVDAFFRRRDADLVEHFDRAVAGLGLADVLVHANGLADLVRRW